MSRTDRRFHVLNAPPLLLIAGWLFTFAMVGGASFICFYNLAKHAQSEALSCERERGEALVKIIEQQRTMNDLAVLFTEEQRKKKCHTSVENIGGEN